MSNSSIVRVDQLSSAITELIEEMNQTVIDGCNDAALKAAKAGAKELRATSPVRSDGYNRKYAPGSYAKSWKYKEGTESSSKISKSYGISGYTIYNAKHYQLAHLLEFGHIIAQTGKRSKAISHIAPVNESVSEQFVSEVENLKL